MDELTIKTQRLILRPFTESDAEPAGRNSRQPSAVRYLSDMVWADEDEAREFIKYFNMHKLNLNTPHVILGIFLHPEGAHQTATEQTVAELTAAEQTASSDACIGFVGVGPKDELGGEIELGYLIADEFSGNGYATEAAGAMIRWAFERAGLDALSAIADPTNAASLRILEKLGFMRIKTMVFPDGNTFVYYRLCQTGSVNRNAP